MQQGKNNSPHHTLRSRTGGRLFAVAMLFAIVGTWLFVIVGFSQQPYEEQSIKPVLMKYLDEDRLRQILPNVTLSYGDRPVIMQENPYRFIEFVVRKMAHVTVYMIFAMSIALALRLLEWSRWRTIQMTLISILIVASIDETIQGGMAGRTGMWEDVVVDAIGGLLGIFIILAIDWGAEKETLHLRKNKITVKR